MNRRGQLALLAATVAALAAGCGANQATPTEAERVAADGRQLGPRYGISIALPAGWDGRLRRGALYAATFAVSAEPLACWVEMACPKLAPDDARIVLYENGRDNRSPPMDLSQYPELTRPLRFQPDEFSASDDNSVDSLRTGHGFARRTFKLSGRLFVVFAEIGSRPPATGTLTALNELLASLSIDAGDFYPGTVQPARFPDRRAWHTGTSGPDESDGDGEFTTSWAATIPYADQWNALPPFQTLKHLPADGILIWLGLSRNNRVPPRPEGRNWFPTRQPPFSLDDFERHDMWEGQVRDLPDYVLQATVGSQYEIYLHVYFGRRHPNEQMLAEAQAMLDGLKFPDWGPWETG